MRRIISGAKKAFRHDQKQVDESQTGQEVWNLNLSPESSDGYNCWDNKQCELCSNFLNSWFILQMFTSKFVDVGKAADLLTWSQAGGGCDLCKYLFLMFIEEMDGNIPMHASFIIRWNTASTGIEGGRRVELSSFDFELSWGYEERTIHARRVPLNCYTNADQDIAHYVTTRPANAVVASPAAFAKAKAWLAECRDSHAKCQRTFTESAEMPSRVLEISQSENIDYSIRLHQTTDELISYVALSYIWGGAQTYQTLKSNIEQRMSHIDAEKLPRTIMDAVRCTQSLGFKYLWVDSLCIVQDSLEDKSTEIGRMSGIYKNAQITISAAAANSCEEGFLEPRAMIHELRQASFRLEMLTPKDPIALNQWIEKYSTKRDFSNLMMSANAGVDFEPSVWNHPDAWCSTSSTVWLAGRIRGDAGERDLLTAGNIKDEPISKRGWTLQEALLSPRQLIYGCRQLVWRCSTGVQVDGGVPDIDSSSDLRTRYQIDGDGNVAHNEEGSVGKSEREARFGALWQDIVRDYSRRSLTVAADKVNALEGIAQELRRQTGDVYLAGLWKSHLISHLSWYQDASHIGSESMLWNTERSCPTWSWTNTDGPVSFSRADHASAVIEDAKIPHHEMIGEYPNLRLEISGSITLRAPMSTLPVDQILPYFKYKDPESRLSPFTNVIFVDGGLSNPEFSLQTTGLDGEGQSTGSGDRIVGAPDDLRFLELSRGRTGGRQNIATESQGLLLVPVNAEGRIDVFQRVGFFVVALQEEVFARPYLTAMLSVEPVHLKPTNFGEIWIRKLKEEVVILI